MSATLADPVAMIQMGAPRLIASDVELGEYTRRLFDLTAKEEPTAGEIEAINLLSMLVQHYEAEHFPLPDVSASEMLRYLMDLQGFSEEDMVTTLGSQQAVSGVLHGERELTVADIARLAKLLGVSPAVFFPAMEV